MLWPMNTTPARGLEIVGRSSAAQPRTFRLERHATSRDAAYRRLATVIMRLDVASLADELRALRLGISLPRAA
jgi:hypothetical protein